MASGSPRARACAWRASWVLRCASWTLFKVRNAFFFLLPTLFCSVHPTGLVDPNNPNARTVILAGEALRGNGGLLLNASGHRFVNELGYRDVASNAIFAHGSKLQLSGGVSPTSAYATALFFVFETLTPHSRYLVLNDAAVAQFPEAIAFYSFKKLVLKFAHAAAFCNATGLPLDAVRATFAAYNAAASQGQDEFGKVLEEQA